MTYGAIIIDDEKKSREALKNLLVEFCPEINVVGMADTLEKGIELIESTSFDILFLDIEMRTATGFDLLQKLTNHNFEVIFTTAYEKYAIKAIRFGAVDYLLKPIDVVELRQAIQKAIGNLKKRTGTTELADFFKKLDLGKVHKISVSTTDGVLYIDVKQIIRCEAQGAYTVIYLKNKTKVMASKLLKEFEQMLTDHRFFRVHHSHLINIDEVQKYIRSEGVVEMNDGSTVAISLNRKDEFVNRMRSAQ